jgi:hypothetical protein
VTLHEFTTQRHEKNPRLVVPYSISFPFLVPRVSLCE